MTIEARMKEIWGGPAPAAPPMCVFAQQFQLFAEALYSAAQAETERPAPAGLVAVNQNKLLILDKYFEYRNAVPKAHRNRMGTTGHWCIWHVFEDYYNRLRILELSLIPPMLYIPEPAQPQQLPSPPKIAGIFLGEEDEV